MIQEQAAPGAGQVIGGLIGPPQGKWGRRLATVSATVAAGRATWQAVKNYRDRMDYTVAVEQTDELYAPVQRWVLDRMPADAQKALTAHTSRVGRAMPADENGHRPSGRTLRLFYDGSRMQDVTIGGHTVRVGIEHHDPQGSSRDEHTTSLWRPDRIVFAARSAVARDAVIAFLREVAADLERADTSPRLFAATRWGSWYSNRNMMPRPLGSVVLADGLLDALVADLSAFYAAEADYVALGVPWHRGYLLHGPPGTGKTSAVKAIAAHLGLNVYYMPLGDLETDTDLTRLVSDVDQRSVLLLEDIDVLPTTHDRDQQTDQPERFTLTGLLNALDGVVTPHGLVTVMTTNKQPDDLDSALVRPGRADRIEYLGPLDFEQFDRLVVALTDMPPPRNLRGYWDANGRHPIALTPAEVVEVVKRHIGRPAEAIPEIAELVVDRHREGGRRRRPATTGGTP